VVAVLVPAADQSGFATHLDLLAESLGIVDDYFARLRFVDPNWGLERIIAALAGVPDGLAGPWPH